MELYKISDGSAWMHVFAMDEMSALKMSEVSDYFEDSKDDFGKLVNICNIETVDSSKEIEIDFGGMHKIKHTVDEWWYIYAGHCPMVLSQSEY